MPTEIVDLPSKGLLYSEDSLLSKGHIEMKYMTAREEDILTNPNYIKKGIVLDKLLQSLIVTQINYEDLLLGDQNAIMLAARILGYGKDYSFTYKGEKVTVDLSQVEDKQIDESLFKKGKNAFEFTLPTSKTKITFKLLTVGDVKKVESEIESLKKVNKDLTPDVSTRLKYMITSVEGNPEQSAIREFVDQYLLARDSKALRDYIKQVQPDVDMTFNFDGPDNVEEGVNIPININFFWPEY